MYKNNTLLRRLGLALGLVAASTLASANQAEKPNFLLIIADDLGYSDIGTFGGEIETPSLDALANEGIRMTNFHTAPTCSPTRSMLFSGTDNHRAGIGNMAELLTPEQKGKPGYEGHLNDLVVTLPEVLRDNGYHTSTTGKWHLGRTEELSPAVRGFDESWVLVQGGASHFDDGRAIIGVDPKAIYLENGKQVEVPKDFFSSDFYADKAIEYVNAAGDKPFFHVLSFTAPHWPLHAPDSYIKKYEGRYDEGYEAIRQQRLGKMKEMGLVGHMLAANVPFNQLPSWDELTDEQRKIEARKMEIYAAMVDNMDENIGRVMAHLQKSGKLDNTVVMFMSDNGADGNSPEVLPRNKEWIASEYDNSFENMGRRDSYIWYGAQWGQVSATPWPMWKGYPSQGGLLVPAILNLPGDETQGEVNHQFFHVMDIMPTFLELAGIEVPSSPYKGRQIFEIQGVSMLPGLNGNALKNRVVGWELYGRSAVRMGDWKIRLLEEPYGPGEWQLFNLAEDPTETNDLASKEPEKLKQLLAEWDKYVKRNGVIAADPADMRKVGYSFTTCLYGKCVE
ncbi:arylsulfatase [Marinobacter nauticus]|jgi:arylsulfatase|uniref:Arylsulfatase n=1 Tax=Marinobacter nauticus TaxID=2743 RepID=A0A368UTU4_MARNT|nr:arylsulfatase [Marinobacter nauticus]MCC4269900.1 arylsulfatase [Marinobacter nauticus]MCG8522322.1 arylsulfatase [Pseudomonadales bacterium]RBP70902.1 arylsulfatase [Marinobacter nauticus]RCW32202.1 arylsulfatase [Marinobacter nauticus]